MVNDRDEIRKACEAATPGPWYDDSQPSAQNPYLVMLSSGGYINAHTPGNVAFIAGAREWVPALLAENDELVAAVEALTEERDARIVGWSCPDCAFTFDADHEDVDGGGHSCPACGELRAEAQVSEQAQVIEGLREALRKYGAHLWSCHTQDHWAGIHPSVCTCDLDATLASLPPKETTPDE